MKTRYSAPSVKRTSFLLCIITISLVTQSLQPAYGQNKEGKKSRSSKNDARLKTILDRFPQSDTDKDGVLSAKEARDFLPKFREWKRKQLERRRKAEANRPKPHRADVKYGRHERNVFDLWLPEDASGENRPAVFVYFHGGGFVAGDKSRFDPTPYLKMGYAVVSANYRFVDGKDVLCPVPMGDGARVVQFLRHKAKTFGIDPSRIALSGGSAGAVITMWIAYGDDLAEPDSDDPVKRQSSRVSCIVPIAGPTNLDPGWINENLGGPASPHPSMSKFYGVAKGDFQSPKVMKMAKQSSPIHLTTADDPPSMLIYGGRLDNLPLADDASHGVRIHHPYFGKLLKDKLDKLGVDCKLHVGDRPTPEQIGKFLDEHMKK